MTTSSRRLIHFVRDGEPLSPAAAEAFVDAVEAAIDERGIATVALCGGALARKLFDLLTDAPFAERLEPLWPLIHVFFSSERHVGPSDRDSVYRVVHWSLLSRFAIPGRNIHRVRTTMIEARSLALAYELELRRFFEMHALMQGGLPCLDLALVALEPGREREGVERRRDAEGRWVKAEDGEIVLTLPVVGNARSTLVLSPRGDAVAAGGAVQLLRFVA